jgi:hypothetical protein
MNMRALMAQGSRTPKRGHRGQPGIRGQNLDGSRLSGKRGMRKARRGRR